MSESKTVVNVEEFIGKTVGRRRPPRDAMQMGMAMQNTTNQLLRSFGHQLHPRGVFRFRTHQEANEWAQKMISPKKAN
ncbi:MAG: hypothetical protein JWO08_692 [Verrucomicrobiaceae bacterium]|nr:hypothetical protein [Verrucomicrobiaceae bacterium]